MKRSVPLTVLLLACCTLAPVAWPASVPGNISTAVTDGNRPPADRERDAGRKPAETLAFAQVKRGETVAELIPGGGYFTRILSVAVGGKGHVYEWVPPRPEDAPPQMPDFMALIKPVIDDPRYANVSAFQQGYSKGLAPQRVDLVFTAQNYHDLHNHKEIDVAAFNRAVRDALKPGGLYVVIDHSAETGSGVRETQSLHRIDIETVKSEVLAAGFEFVAASTVLANPADPRTAKVFDPAIRGKTDQFILKFRKPKS
jgi:predicted methyltransferase